MSESVEERTLDRDDRGDREDDTAPALSRYQIHHKLAVGGMAEIFVAQKHGSPDVCVVKQLHAHLTEDSVVGARFLREAQVASLLNHPHIARLTDAGREGRFYLAMEFIAGQDVETMMFRLMEQRKMLPPELSVTVTLDVLEGLEYAHNLTGESGKPLEIVHRDLSPRNVMVTYDGRVKIIDFGLARTNLGDFRTAPGMVLGTMRYMSPEQAVAEPVDRRSDVYSWSVVLYEMLSGRPLVMGQNAQEVLNAVVTQVPPPLSTLNAALPRELDEVLEKGLAKDRRDRFASAGELRRALMDAAGGLGAIDDERHGLIGRFVRELFPTEYAETKQMLEHLERGEGAFEPTRIGPAQHEVTRATYLKRIQTMQSAAEAAVERAPAPEMTRLVIHDRSSPGLREPSRSVTPALASARAAHPTPQTPPLKDQRRLMYALVGIVAFAMFTVAGAVTWIVINQPSVVITDVDPVPSPVVAVKVEAKAPSVQKSAELSQPAPLEKRAIEDRSPTTRGKNAAQEPPRRRESDSKVQRSALPEVQRIKVLYGDVAEALSRARSAVEALGDGPMEVDIEPLKLAADLIRAHADSLDASRRDPVTACLRGIDFGPPKERFAKVERCYRKLEEAGR